ncbi:FAD binding domain-containing protein [Fusarium tricinctum]|uniref:FAD binding domain-containing protein n=1 Tax=Fusarium tricinctum TaxID=61284 RepID=A0A8K0S2Z3_9HYPO|nr:FAD binding domain-containing protein [Fusarium tricinctum]
MRLLTSVVSVWLAGGLAQANYVVPRDLVIYDTVKAACSELQGDYPRLTLFPNTRDYDDEVINTWDKRANLIPGCIFRPTKDTQVAKALSIFHRNRAEFAVRGGGHLPYPGSNSINDGILIVLAGLDKTKVNPEKGTVEVGGGCNWNDVYKALGPYGLYTNGGRLKTIGVPGLTLLGGVHYFLNKYGFTMDSVVNYEVVLGNGTKVQANRKQHPDLFWALKGGALNYGIVTKFEFKTFKARHVTSTFQIFPESATIDYIKAACDMVLSDDGSVGAGAVININYNTTTKKATPQIFGLQEGTKSPPSRFANFTSIPNAVTRVHNVTTPVEWHSKFDTPNQMFRVSFGHHTIKPDAERLTEIYKAWIEAIADIVDVPGLFPTFILNLAPRTAATVAKKNGIGNTFGLDDKEPYIWWQLTTSWARSEDDVKVTTWARTFLEGFHAENKDLGLSTGFLYGGDVAEYQNPLLQYPQKNVDKMRRIRDKYDPDRVFSKLNWGGFKLGL